MQSGGYGGGGSPLSSATIIKQERERIRKAVSELSRVMENDYLYRDKILAIIDEVK